MKISEQDVRDVLASRGPLSRKDLLDALGVQNSALATPLGNLSRSGELEVDHSQDPWMYGLRQRSP